MISVVVPTHNRQEILQETVRRLLNHEPVGGGYEVVVVDDHSEDGTHDWLTEQARRERRLQVLRSPRRGRSAARNAGLAAASGELVVFLDDDMWVAPGFLTAHLRAYREAAGAAVVNVGRMRPWPGNTPTLANLAYDRRLAHIDDCMARCGDDLPCRYLCTGNVSIPRRLLEPGPAFDEGFEGYSFEDTELGYSLAARGVRFRYVAEASAEHRTDMTVAAHLRKRAEMGRSAVRLLQRYPEAAAYLEIPYEVPGVPGTARQEALARQMAKALLFTPLVARALAGISEAAAALGATNVAQRALSHAGYAAYGGAYCQTVATLRQAPRRHAMGSEEGHHG